MIGFNQVPFSDMFLLRKVLVDLADCKPAC